jgi:hypothetical protein
MAYGTYFERRAKRIFDGEFSPTFMCELMRKDAGLALALAKASHVPTPILDETKRTYDEAVDSGWGKEDFSAVTHVIEKRIGRKLSRGQARRLAAHREMDALRGCYPAPRQVGRLVLKGNEPLREAA